MKKRWIFLLLASIGGIALADGIPSEFQGTWSVDSAATAKRIEADSQMSDENKAYWVKRFTDGEESKIKMIIDDKSVGMAVLGTFSVNKVLEASPGHVSLTAVISDPRSGEEWKLNLGLQMEDSNLNMTMDSGGQFDDDDFDRVMWVQRSGEVAKAVNVSGDPVHYLDSLKACEPGEFVFTNTEMGKFQSSIVGRNGKHCQVITVHSGHRIICNYSDATIALLTTEQKYNDARNGILQGSTGSLESKRANEECALE